MNNIRRFFSFTKYFWIGGIMGFTQQILGSLNYEIFNLSQIMGSFGLYAMIILLLIHRDKPPKKQFLDIFLFFVGLDFFYALYIFFADISNYFSYNAKYPENTRETAYFFQKTYGEILGFFYWTSIGTAAAVWGLLTAKFRDKGWKKRYILMLIPLFALIFLEFAETVIETWSYFEDEYRRIHNMTVLPYAGPSPKNKLAAALTDLAGLVVCPIIYLKKKKTDIQTKGTL